MQIRHTLAVAAIFLGLPALVHASTKDYSILDGSTVSYHLVHKLHKVVGKARLSEGKARVLPDGTLQVMVRARVEDFDSDNSNRDAHMKEVTEAAKFPFIEFKGVASSLKIPDSLPCEVPVTLKGRLTFHGVTQEVEVPLKAYFASAREVFAKGQFALSLESYGVKRPGLMMMKVEDEVTLEVKLTLVLDET